MHRSQRPRESRMLQKLLLFVTWLSLFFHNDKQYNQYPSEFFISLLWPHHKLESFIYFIHARQSFVVLSTATSSTLKNFFPQEKKLQNKKISCAFHNLICLSFSPSYFCRPVIKISVWLMLQIFVNSTHTTLVLVDHFILQSTRFRLKISNIKSLSVFFLSSRHRAIKKT